MVVELGEIRSKDIEWRTAILNGKRVIYQETTYSPKTEAPLVMIPGWPVSSNMFQPLMGEIGSQVKCFALNLPGYGGSQTDFKTNHTFAYYVDFIDRFRDQIVRTDKINFFGYSTGGVLGILYSNKYPEHTDRLAVFSVPYDGPNHYELTSKKKPRFYGLFNLATKHREFTRIINFPMIRKLLINSVFRDMYLRKYPKLTSIPNFVDEMKRETSKIDFKAAVDLASELVYHDFSGEAGHVHVPTLVIAAENDEAVSSERTKQLANLISGSQFVEIPDADHSVGIVEPEKMSGLILKFLFKLYSF